MPTKSKWLRARSVVSICVIIILLCDLSFLFFIKYNNQGLQLSNFNLLLIGNIINLIFTVIAVIGVILYAIKMKSGFNSRFLLYFVLFLSLVLLIAEAATKLSLPLPNVYFLDHPLQLIFIGAIFSFYQYMQFLFIGIIWANLLGGKELVILRAIVNSAGLVMLFLVFAFVYINLKKVSDNKFMPDKNSIDAAVVLGAAVWPHNAPSPSLAARADKAVELYKKKIVDKIQLTGSNAPGELSEAEVAYNYIKIEGVDTSDIWMETKTVSTAEQIRFIKNYILTKNDIGRVIIVSDAYHLTRVREMCKFYRIKADVAASDLKLSFQHNLYYKLKESIALLVFWFFAL